MDHVEAPTFGTELRRLRCERGLSVRQLAAEAHHSKSVISDWETGKKSPTADVAACLDKLLGGGGTLADLGEAAAAPDPHQLLLRESERITEQLAAIRPGELVDEMGRSTDRLALEYLHRPGAELTEEITAARREAFGALRARRLRGVSQTKDLLADVGYLSGILAYAALDDGHPGAAYGHTVAAWEAAELVGSDQLRAWVRGTQSLILRFQQRYTEALEHAEDGLRYAKSGTARARLLAGVGQCMANMGDATATQRALTRAETSFEEQRGTDDFGGLFTFSRAKLYYYSGSSLIWLNGGEPAERARTQAHTAIELWEAGDDRSVADEALARVYAATASLQLRDLEEAASELEPILSMPAEQRVSWIVKRMDRITGMLKERPFESDPLARDLLERISDYR